MGGIYRLSTNVWYVWVAVPRSLTLTRFVCLDDNRGGEVGVCACVWEGGTSKKWWQGLLD